MKVIRLRDQSEERTPDCGVLKNIFHSEEFGVVKFDNIGVTGRHYHRKLKEVYCLLKGTIVVEVHEKGTKFSRKVKLNEGEALLLYPGDIHKVIKVSKVNSLLVFCIPDWRKSDEILVKDS